VERVAWDEQLHLLAAAQAWSDDDPFFSAVGVQQEHFQRITEILISS
jgi:hypothetical protein